ncbi:MAG: DUF6273 domain-containing protein [Anaerovoracaceae bacterium]|jgi:hypothetical protein
MVQLRIKKKLLRGLAVVLALATALVFFPTLPGTPGRAKAGTSQGMISMGTNGIAGYDSASDKYTYIYYGNYAAPLKEGNPEEPVCWDVASTSGNGGTYSDGVTSPIFLIADQCQTGYSGDFDTSEPYSSDYQESNVRSWCGSYYDDAFSKKEKAAIVGTTKSDPALTVTLWDQLGIAGQQQREFTSIASDNILNGDKVFLLSAAEVLNQDYGFVDDAHRVCGAEDPDFGFFNMQYGLRTAWPDDTYNGSTTKQALVTSVYDYDQTLPGTIKAKAGQLVRHPVKDSPFSMRPAMNLNPDSILFTSSYKDSEGKVSGAEGKDALTAVSTNAPQALKLTLKDSSRAFEAKTTAVNGNTLTVTYSGASIGENEYISAMVVDDNGTPLYYGNLKSTAAAADASGTLQLTLPTSFDAAKDKVYLFSEQRNGDRQTDYASAMKQLSLKPDSTKPNKPKKPKAPRSILLASATAKGKTSQTIRWTNVRGAAGYDIYFAKCNFGSKKYRLKKVKTVRAGKKRVWTKKGLQCGTTYKCRVRAYKYAKGKKTYIASSFLTHSIAGNLSGNRKFTNTKSIKPAIRSATLKTGKTKTLKSKLYRVKRGKKLLKTSHAAYRRYLSSNKAVAVVNEHGKIKAKKKGKCTVYIVAQNGLWKGVTVTVK